MKNSKKIIICGNFGAGNLGDDAILAGIQNLLKSSFTKPEVSFMSGDLESNKNAIYFFPAGFKSLLKFYLTINGWKSILKMWNSDLIIFGGGGLFNDDERQSIWIWFIQFLGFYILRKKIIIIGQSVGPIKYDISKKIVKFVFGKAKFISVRDQNSVKLLNELNIRNAHNFSDAAFALSYGFKRNINISDEILLTFREWNYNDQFKTEYFKFLKKVSQNQPLSFIPFQNGKNNDLNAFNKYLNNFKGNITIKSLEPEDFNQAIEIIGRGKLVIGMRLHSIIFAIITNTPFIAISYSKKVSDFLSSIGMSKYCIDVKNFNHHHVLNLVDEIKNDSAEIKLKLEKIKLNQTYLFFENEKYLKSIN